jgi:hypothetical protein
LAANFAAHEGAVKRISFEGDKLTLIVVALIVTNGVASALILYFLFN